jgi:hypothetical protein
LEDPTLNQKIYVSRSIITVGYHDVKLAFNTKKEHSECKGLTIKDYKCFLNTDKYLGFGEKLMANEYFILYLSTGSNGSSGGPIIDVVS